MADRRFYRPEGPFSLAALAERTESRLSDHGDPGIQITDIAPLESAGADQISFLDNKLYLPQLPVTKAGAVIVHPDHAAQVPDTAAVVLNDQPYRAYARVAKSFYPFRRAAGVVDARAAIDPTAKLGADCRVDAGAVIGGGVEIGDRCSIAANAVIGDNVVIGDDCTIGSHASLSFCLIGNRVTLYPGVRIGQDGFGFARDPAGHLKVPQVGRVIIHDDVEIGANTTIDRGSGPDTVIGPGCMIDNLVQIGHNVQLGRGCVIVAQVGISGSTKLEDYVVLAGQVGVAGHLTIGGQAVVAAKSGIARNLAGGRTYGGIPAVPMEQWRRQCGMLARMVKKHMASRSAAGEAVGKD